MRLQADEVLPLTSGPFSPAAESALQSQNKNDCSVQQNPERPYFQYIQHPDLPIPDMFMIVYS